MTYANTISSSRHAGTVDSVDYTHEHHTVASLIDCVDNFCVMLLTPQSIRVEYVGKHGIRYPRGNN